MLGGPGVGVGGTIGVHILLHLPRICRSELRLRLREAAVIGAIRSRIVRSVPGARACDRASTMQACAAKLRGSFFPFNCFAVRHVSTTLIHPGS